MPQLDPRDITTRHGIPVTTVARTLVDLTDVLTPYQLANVIYEAAYRGLFNEKRRVRRWNEPTAATTSTSSTQHWPCTQRQRRDTQRQRGRLLSMLSFAGLPEPRVNTELHGEEVDCHWPDRKLAVEVDGPGHERPRARRSDARTTGAHAGRLQLLRFTDEDLDKVVTQVRAALPPGRAPRPARAGRR